jgi:hypothetical protein
VTPTPRKEQKSEKQWPRPSFARVIAGVLNTEDAAGAEKKEWELRRADTKNGNMNLITSQVLLRINIIRMK